MSVKQFRYANCVAEGVLGSSTVKSYYKKDYVDNVFKINFNYKFCIILDIILQNASTACLGLP